MNIQTINKSIVPEQFLKSAFKPLMFAISNVQKIEGYYPKLSLDETQAIKTYLNASSTLMSDYVYNPKSTFLADFRTYLTIHCNFNLSKNEKIDFQIISVLAKIGSVYPDLGVYEVFDAIDFCLSKKPELCKSYDSKEGQSSFTSVWLAQIVDYYFQEGRVDFRPVIARLMLPIENQKKEIDLITEKNLEKIKIYRNICSMVLINIGRYLYMGEFEFSIHKELNGKPFIDWLYENMIYVGFLTPSAEVKKAAWIKWENAKDENKIDFTERQKISFSKQEMIVSKIKQVSKDFTIETENEWIVDKAKIVEVLAYQLGFLQDTPEINLTTDWEISELLATYGKAIVNVFPLLKHELIIPEKISGGVGSVMREKFNSIVST